jgi:hypothetical protein
MMPSYAPLWSLFVLLLAFRRAAGEGYCNFNGCNGNKEGKIIASAGRGHVKYFSYLQHKADVACKAKSLALHMTRRTTTNVFPRLSFGEIRMF